MCACAVVFVVCVRLTVYEGCQESDPWVRSFWSVVCDRFDDDERAALIRFAWGRSRLPLVASEFERRFKLQRLHVRTGASPDDYLPVAHTVSSTAQHSTALLCTALQRHAIVLPTVVCASLRCFALLSSPLCRHLYDRRLVWLLSICPVLLVVSPLTELLLPCMCHLLIVCCAVLCCAGVLCQCFFSLELPPYSSVDVCHRKLLYAVQHCVAIDVDSTEQAQQAGAVAAGEDADEE